MTKPIDLKDFLLVSLILNSKLNWFSVIITRILFKNSYSFCPPSNLPSDSLQSDNTKWCASVCGQPENVGPRNDSILNASKFKGRYKLAQAQIGYRFIQEYSSWFPLPPLPARADTSLIQFPQQNKYYIPIICLWSTSKWNFHSVSVPEKAQSLSLSVCFLV